VAEPQSSPSDYGLGGVVSATQGEGFQDVYQLSGGIQRYLDAYPEGGFFHGKNFVFDDRIAVGSAREEMVGTCSVCRHAACDDYRCGQPYPTRSLTLGLENQTPTRN
jgi:predicted sulfurtransferase